jgi:hypothetical protein
LLTVDNQKARELHGQLLPFLNFMMQSVEFLIAYEKQVLVERGILLSAYCREPAYQLDSIQKAELKTHQDRLASWLARVWRFSPVGVDPREHAYSTSVCRAAAAGVVASRGTKEQSGLAKK